MTLSSPSITLPPAGRYRIDPAASAISFTVKHVFGLATVRGSVSVVSGELSVAEDVRESCVSIRADASSFESGDARRDKTVKAAKFLDVQAYPSLEFESSAVSEEGGRWTVAGTLTAHGVAAPLTLTVTHAHTDGEGITIHATGQVDRYAHQVTATKGLTGRFLAVQVIAKAVAVDAPS